MAITKGRYTVLTNVRGLQGVPGPPGDPLNAAGWAFMKKNFDALDGADPRIPRLGGRGFNEVHTDSKYLQSWLGSRETDGGPSEWAMWWLRKELGIVLVNDPLRGVALTSSAGEYTDLTTRTSDGQIEDWVMDRWAPRIASRIGSGGGAGSGFATTDRYLDAGVQKRMFPDTRNMVTVGSSTLEFITPYLDAVFSPKGVTLNNWAKNGERAEHIAARFGSRPALLTVDGGSIPASGAVTVTASNMPPSGSLKPFDGVLAGVHGTLSSTGTVITFTRSTAGSVTSVPAGTAFIPDGTGLVRNMVAVIELGKNNQRDEGAPALVNAITDQTYAYLEPFVKRAILVEQFVHSNELVGSTQFQNVYATNADRLAKYGDQLCRVNEYILSPQIWADTGITPTTEDLQLQADGIKPWSISADAGHFNDAAYTAVAAFILAHAQRVGMV